MQTAFDADIDAYIVSLPGSVSLAVLKTWGAEFMRFDDRWPGVTENLLNESERKYRIIENRLDCIAYKERT